DLNAAAHALIKRFRSIGRVLEADCGELAKTEGIGANMAEYLAVLGNAMRLMSGGENTFACVPNVCKFKKFITARPVPQTDCIEFYCLDKDGGVRRICTFSAKGGLRAEPSESEILTLLSVHRPYGLFVAARRLNGGAVPDGVNDALSEKIDNIVRLCGATMYDYCLVGGDGGFYSYKMHDRTVFANR
ncbi:MAG: hypothetical protein K2O81_04590, partial [Clostridia bacterium]|nr:hypothetical protein [Clostridia bacterium]